MADRRGRAVAGGAGLRRAGDPGTAVGYSYQWASRLANAGVGWWLGWMSFAFLSIVTVSVDYGLVQVAFQPLIGETFTPTSAALETLAVLAIRPR